MEFPAAFVVAMNDLNRVANSARPDAPVVPETESAQRTHAVRLAVSGALYRAARAIAPPERSPAC